jgi:site-specific DNA recombinase
MSVSEAPCLTGKTTARCAARHTSAEAEAFDDIVLAAVGAFYRTRTDLITQAITAAQDDYRATKAAVQGELSTVTSQMAQKEATVDQYFTDYEEGKIDKTLLEARIEKLGVEPRALRRHRDELHLRIDDEPQHLTAVDLTALNAYIGEVIDHGTAAVRKSLCEAAIHELRIDLKHIEGSAPVDGSSKNCPPTCGSAWSRPPRRPE